MKKTRFKNKKKPIEQFNNVININSITEVLTHLKEGDAVYFDIDDTILTSLDFVGSEVSQELLWEELSKKFDPATAEMLGFLYWQAAQKFNAVILVEEIAITVHAEIKKRGHSIQYVTAREASLREITYQQLEKIKWPLFRKVKKTKKTKKENRLQKVVDDFMIDHDFIFCGEVQKYKGILAHLKQQGHSPKRIVLIDDRLSHLTLAAEHFRKAKMAFLGLFYDRVRRLNYHRIPKGCQSIHDLYKEFVRDEVGLQEIKEKSFC
jgi:acid phosphatase class B